MKLFQKTKEQPGDYYPEPKKEVSTMKPMKWFVITVGGVIGVAHIGILGHLLKPQPEVQQPPAFNIPHTPYSSYRIKAGKDGYTIEYRANDPKVLESSKTHASDKAKKGLFGGSTEVRRETRYDQYTMEGIRNMGSGGAVLDGEGKSAKDVECIVADAGARSQGAMAGTAISTGLLAPAVMNVPYVGWLAAGWVNLLGQNVGSAAGSQVNSLISDC